MSSCQNWQLLIFFVKNNIISQKFKTFSDHLCFNKSLYAKHKTTEILKNTLFNYKK
jgi:hypothetical protein